MFVRNIIPDCNSMLERATSVINSCAPTHNFTVGSFGCARVIAPVLASSPAAGVVVAPGSPPGALREQLGAVSTSTHSTNHNCQRCPMPPACCNLREFSTGTSTTSLPNLWP